MHTFDECFESMMEKGKNDKAHGNWIRAREGLPLVPTEKPSVARDEPIEHHPKGTSTDGFEPDMTRLPYDVEKNSQDTFGTKATVAFLKEEVQKSNRVANVTGQEDYVQGEGVRRVVGRMKMSNSAAIEKGAESIVSWLVARKIQPQYRKVDPATSFEYVIGCLSDVYFRKVKLPVSKMTVEQKNEAIMRCGFVQEINQAFGLTDRTNDLNSTEVLSDTQTGFMSLPNAKDFLMAAAKSIYAVGQSTMSRGSASSLVLYEPFVNGTALETLDFDLKNVTQGASTFVHDATVSGDDFYSSPSKVASLEEELVKGRGVNAVQVGLVKTESIFGTSANGFAAVDGGFTVLGGNAGTFQIVVVPETVGLKDDEDWFKVIIDGTKVLAPTAGKEGGNASS